MKKKSTLLFLLLNVLFTFFCFKSELIAQTAMVTIDYNGYTNYCCSANTTSYFCFNSPSTSGYCGSPVLCNTQSFIDPVPAGNIVTSISINYYTAGCGAGQMTGTLNGNTFPIAYESNTGCLCSNAAWQITGSSTNNYPCGISGYNYGAPNNFQMCALAAQVCIDRAEITMTYKPANQAVPASQPGAITGSSTFCAGVPEVFSISPVSNATSYTWSVPAGWVINSGQGTTSINATPGTAGNICVIATNLCGNSAQTCFPVVMSTPSSAPASASANPSSVCGSGTTNLTVNGGSLGASANWNWYTGSCGGTLVGTGSSISVSASSSTTYFVRAVGACNTTACVSVLFTVNPIPSANAGSTSILTCTSPSAVLSGSGGGSYSWTGPGIVSGNTTANPTVNQPGVYSLIVTSSGCASPPSNVTITSNTTAPTPGASNSSTLTCTNPTAVLTGSGGGSYSWSGPGIVSGGTSANPTVNTGGNYIVTVTAANGCTATANTSISQNTTPPVATASNSTALNCLTTSATLTGTGGGTYSWSGPGIVSGGTTPNPVVNAGGVYNLTVTAANGCKGTANTTVSQNTTPPTPTASNSGTLNCSTNTITLTGTGGGTYSWSGPGIVSGNTTANPIVNLPGTYNLTVTAANNCTATASTAVSQNTVLPTVSVSNSSYTTTCATPTVTFNALANPSSNVTYNWTAPSTGALNNYSISNPIASGSGIFTVAVTNTLNGCSTPFSTQATIQVTADAGSPAVSISQSTASLTCNTSVQTATVTSNPSSSITYTWSPVPASGLNSAVATFTAPGTYICSVTNTLNSCPATTQIVISTNTATPTLSVTPTVTLNCNPLVASISSTVNPGSGLNFSWSGSGIIGAGTTSTVSVNSTGVYTLTALNPVNGCSATATSTVVSNSTPPTLSITPSSTLISCSTPTLNLTASTNLTVTPVWNTPIGNSNNPIVAAVAGNYTVSVTDPLTGCKTSSIIVVGGGTVQPAINSAATAVMPCGSGVITLSASTTASNPVTYSWVGPGNSCITSGSTTATPIINATGVYTVTVTDAITGCSSTSTVNVTQGSITAAFTADPTSGIAPLLINLTNQSTGTSLTYNWSFGDGNSSTGVDPTTTYTTNGTYTIMLIATSGTCKDTATTVIVVDDGLSLEIPNVFTPNNDGKNDFFTIKSTGIKEISLQIFNRWGEKMYEFSGTKAAWDGMTGQGNKVPDATYFYFVKATSFDNKNIEKQGTVNLFR